MRTIREQDLAAFNRLLAEHGMAGIVATGG
jgi:hypothetical protein